MIFKIISDAKKGNNVESSIISRNNNVTTSTKSSIMLGRLSEASRIKLQSQFWSRADVLFVSKFFYRYQLSVQHAQVHSVMLIILKQWKTITKILHIYQRLI